MTENLIDELQISRSLSELSNHSNADYTHIGKWTPFIVVVSSNRVIR